MDQKLPDIGVIKFCLASGEIKVTHDQYDRLENILATKRVVDLFPAHTMGSATVSQKDSPYEDLGSTIYHLDTSDFYKHYGDSILTDAMVIKKRARSPDDFKNKSDRSPS